MNTRRTFAIDGGFSIVEALIAMGLVVLALVGLFGVMPYTYRTLQDDSLRTEALSAAQRYLDDVRMAVQSGQPTPASMHVPLDLGESFTTGQSNGLGAAVDLSATCVQPNGAGTLLYDCTISVVLSADGAQRTLTPLETYVARQLP